MMEMRVAKKKKKDVRINCKTTIQVCKKFFTILYAQNKNPFQNCLQQKNDQMG